MRATRRKLFSTFIITDEALVGPQLTWCLKTEIGMLLEIYHESDNVKISIWKHNALVKKLDFDLICQYILVVICKDSTGNLMRPWLRMMVMLPLVIQVPEGCQTQSHVSNNKFVWRVTF
jgi:hypothetical protein